MRISKKANPRKVIVCVFAHPDDEAFGPAGTIIKLAKSDDVYILCATRGEGGSPEGGGDQRDIGKIRQRELLKSAKILGVKKVYFLGFIDGNLCNAIYRQLAHKIEDKIKFLNPDTLLTFEPRGISGHVDHITVSLVTTYVFYRMPFVKKLLYYCISDEERKLIKNYFIYFPPGYKISEIDKVVDISDEWQTKIKAMMVHKSQVADAKRILKMREGLLKKEHFLVLKK